MIAYHDREWGRPTKDERLLFEMLCLEGAQAGLSWSTILRRRETYRRAYDDFDAQRMARYGAARQRALLQDPGIIRNRLKVDAFVSNAKAYLELRREFGGLAPYLERYRSLGKGRRPASYAALPASTEVSDALSRDLKKRGFRFVGSTICYAFMQAVGLVDDHLRGCWASAAGSTRKRSGTRKAGSRARR